MASFRAAASAVRAFSTSSRQAQLVKAPIQVKELFETYGKYICDIKTLGKTR